MKKLDKRILILFDFKFALIEIAYHARLITALQNEGGYRLITSYRLLVYQ